jgi:hypothetical protein
MVSERRKAIYSRVNSRVREKSPEHYYFYLVRMMTPNGNNYILVFLKVATNWLILAEQQACEQPTACKQHSLAQATLFPDLQTAHSQYIHGFTTQPKHGQLMCVR